MSTSATTTASRPAMTTAITRPTRVARPTTAVQGAASVRRGNHPAGRALVAVPAGRSAEPLAEVLPFRPRPAGTAPLRRRPTGTAPLRLTRRGRRVVVGLAAAGGVGLAALVGAAVLGDGPTGPELSLAGESSILVQAGDTLWSIAGELAPDEDPRGVVDALRAANDLDGTAIQPGQVLLVP